MTVQRALDAVLAERFGPPVRQRTGAMDGPTAYWLASRHRVDTVRHLYFVEQLPTQKVAALTGVPWVEVVAIVDDLERE